MRNARLFAAIAFSPPEKRALAQVAGQLKALGATGRFPDAELLHITLHFFGETPLDRLGDIEAAFRLAAREHPVFTMRTGRAGTFGRRDSQVLWLGVDDGAEALRALQARLEPALADRGFPIESRPFRAHITLARDARFPGDVSAVELSQVSLAVEALTLMESTQAGGRLQYIPLLQVPLPRQTD